MGLNSVTVTTMNAEWMPFLSPEYYINKHGNELNLIITEMHFYRFWHPLCLMARKIKLKSSTACVRLVAK